MPTPRKQVWTVRVIQASAVAVDAAQVSYLPNDTGHMLIRMQLRDRLPDIWIEQMRRAGILRILKDDDKITILELKPPASISPGSSKVWADMNAERMRSFGINAAAAPQWDGYDPLPKE